MTERQQQRLVFIGLLVMFTPGIVLMLIEPDPAAIVILAIAIAMTRWCWQAFVPTPPTPPRAWVRRDTPSTYSKE